MIKLQKLHIEEFRGIRNLDISLNQKTFAVSGPNGSGKSGVIDAIEFALTGKISRLAGQGTKELTVSEHGPHVDMVKFPDAAFVTLDVFIPSLKQSARITRKVSSPKKPTIIPKNPEVLSVLDEISDHPEITLARRDILRFILAEPSKRSEEIQTILNLEDIGQTRAVMFTANGKLSRELKSAEASVSSARMALQRHLDIASFNATDLLNVVNTKRTVLGLPEISKLDRKTILDEGITDSEKPPEFNKSAALRSLEAVDDMVAKLEDIGVDNASAVVLKIGELELDPKLLQALQRRSLVEKGLELVDGPECPMCDHAWPDEIHLRSHLGQKLEKSLDARAIQDEMMNDATAISSHVTALLDLLRETATISRNEKQSKATDVIIEWGKDLDKFRQLLGSFDSLLGLKDRLSEGWSGKPSEIGVLLKSLKLHIEAKPDQTATVEAQTFLSNAQLRLKDYRDEMRNKELAADASKLAKSAYDTYCRIMEEELDALYRDVQQDFSEFYSHINADDESTFTAKLTPSEGRLDFGVNFYDRGLFPPGAYHSEGHQDGMGVCLYLALMRRLLGDNFTVALLDDVVMSVDSGHRRQFCELLKLKFPNTQFVIATHDRLWAEQMKSTKLVTSKTSLAFRSWSVETGPIVESSLEIWAEVEDYLEQGKIETAAHSLRRHLEFISSQLAQGLGARTVHRSDGAYDLGNLLPPILGQMKELLGKAAAAAQSWGNEDAKAKVGARKKLLAQANTAKGDEEWLMNKAVHFNEWANLERVDFEPVVAAFKTLLEALQCDACGSWLYASPNLRPETVRCQCGEVNLSLNAKKT